MSRRAPPRTIRILAGGVPLREPWPSEEEFLRSRPDVAGLASDDGAVVMNPYCLLSEEEREAVALNEAARVVMSTRADLRPDFALTPEQEAAFAHYGPPEAVKATVAARILSGDPSALIPTAEQMAFVIRLAREMGISAHTLAIAANRISSSNSPSLDISSRLYHFCGLRHCKYASSENVLRLHLRCSSCF